MLEVLQPFIFACLYKKKGHNMIALMLDPRFKSLRLVTSSKKHEGFFALIAQYDE